MLILRRTAVESAAFPVLKIVHSNPEFPAFSPFSTSWVNWGAASLSLRLVSRRASSRPIETDERASLHFFSFFFLDLIANPTLSDEIEFEITMMSDQTMALFVWVIISPSTSRIKRTSTKNPSDWKYEQE
jgi:hypothetical protein